MAEPRITFAEPTQSDLKGLLRRPEAEVKREVLKYLHHCGYLAFRLNVGAATMEYKGKRRFIQYGTPGMADILTFVHTLCDRVPVWIECKSSAGRQSPIQRAFQKVVENDGHKYVVVRSVAELIAALAGI